MGGDPININTLERRVETQIVLRKIRRRLNHQPRPPTTPTSNSTDGTEDSTNGTEKTVEAQTRPRLQRKERIMLKHVKPILWHKLHLRLQLLLRKVRWRFKLLLWEANRQTSTESRPKPRDFQRFWRPPWCYRH